MARIVTYPFLRPTADRVDAGLWCDSSTDEPFGQTFEHWDYNTSVSAFRNVEIDIAGVRADCQLKRSDRLAAAVVWHASGTGLRGSGFYLPLENSDSQRVELRVDLQGTQLAGDLALKTQLLLANSRDPGRTPLVPCRAGMILWSDIYEIELEGGRSRFPLELVDFESSAVAPPGAAWRLEWPRDDLREPFMGSVRLYLNQAHEVIVRVVAETQPWGSAKAIWTTIEYEVARTLLSGALDDDEFVDERTLYDRGSIGDAVRRMIQLYWPGERAESIRDLLRSRPEAFDSELQARTRLFHDV